MSEGIGIVGWGIFSALFFGLLVFIVLMRRVESRRIENKFKKESIIISSYGVNYFGLSSEPGGPARSAGTLVLLRDGLYYRARFRKKELFIPGDAITAIRIVETHKGKPLYQKVVAIVFRQDENEVSACFRIPFPDQWIGAIRKNLLSR